MKESGRGRMGEELEDSYRQGVTARTIASEPKLERMPYYEDTKLRRRKRGRQAIRQDASSKRANRRVGRI
jgi:hypothetical protein